MSFNLATSAFTAAGFWLFTLACFTMAVFPQSAIARWLARKDLMILQTIRNRRALAVMGVCCGLFGLYSIGKELSSVTGWLMLYMTWIEARQLLHFGAMITALIGLAAVASVSREA